MRKIAIIGANEAINKLILKAKEKGCETHVFAWACGDIGERNADFFYPISIADKEAITEECRRIKPDGVASITSDFAVNTVNYVARELGLVSNGEYTDEVARNKFKMRCALKAAGLFTPWFHMATAKDEANDLEVPAYPVIVKPTDRWSSKGVTRVENEAALENAIKTAIEESLNGQCIVEGFMQGQEYSCETISYRGIHRILAFTKKDTTGYPHYIETGHHQPAVLSEDSLKRLQKVIPQALDALGITNGASHTEFRILPDGEIGIIEIGARMGGDCIGTDLVQHSTGLDFVGMVLDVACGTKPVLTPISQPTPVGIRFILSKADLSELRRRQETAPETIIHVSEIGEIGSHEVIDSSTRFGYYIYKEA